MDHVRSPEEISELFGVAIFIASFCLGYATFLVATTLSQGVTKATPNPPSPNDPTEAIELSVIATYFSPFVIIDWLISLILQTTPENWKNIMDSYHPLITFVRDHPCTAFVCVMPNPIELAYNAFAQRYRLPRDNAGTDRNLFE